MCLCAVCLKREPKRTGANAFTKGKPFYKISETDLAERILPFVRFSNNRRSEFFRAHKQSKKLTICHTCRFAVDRAVKEGTPVILPSRDPKAGKALFATETYQPKTEITPYGGLLRDFIKQTTGINRSHTRSLVSTIKIDGRCNYRVPVPGLAVKGIGQFANHSKTPNAAFCKYDREITRISIKTLDKPIHEGEEINVDYGRSYEFGPPDKQPLQLQAEYKKVRETHSKRLTRSSKKA